MKGNKQISGKVVLITGATSGIGKETAVALAAMGATVVAVGRNKARSEAALEEIKNRSGNASVAFLQADLSSMTGVRDLAARFLERHSALHVLINNAGFATKERTTTHDGIESQWAVNYLAPFLLTTLLLDCMRDSAPARIINLSATLHTMGALDFDDMEMTNSYKGIKMYARSKTALNSFTFELARRLEDANVTVNCIHPGVVKSNFDAAALFPMAVLFRPFFTSPKKGAEGVVHLASSPEVEGVSGAYFVSRKRAVASEESRDIAKAKRLFDYTANQLGVSDETVFTYG